MRKDRVCLEGVEGGCDGCCVGGWQRRSDRLSRRRNQIKVKSSSKICCVRGDGRAGGWRCCVAHSHMSNSAGPLRKSIIHTKISFTCGNHIAGF
jgi:hypothetical protein